jgi:hypothetical protein
MGGSKYLFEGANLSECVERIVLVLSKVDQQFQEKGLWGPPDLNVLID